MTRDQLQPAHCVGHRIQYMSKLLNSDKSHERIEGNVVAYDALTLIVAVDTAGIAQRAMAPFIQQLCRKAGVDPDVRVRCISWRLWCITPDATRLAAEISL